MLTPLIAAAMLFAAHCGGGGSNSNPPPPNVVIDAEEQLVDVGQRFFLDASQSTDPNGDAEDLEFVWRIADGGGEDTDFDDHCRDDFDEICESNDDDHCSNDESRFCDDDDDCVDLGTCQLNSGTTSSDCTTGICELGEGDEGTEATFVADVAGPFSVRLTAIGSRSNGTGTRVLNTYPSLFVTSSLYQFGGTEGAFLGEVTDANDFAPNATQGVADPVSGNLVVIDSDLDVVRVFDLRTGKILGAFGESDRFANNPVAIAFNPGDDRLHVAEATGRVLMFDGASGLLVGQFGNVGPGAVAMRFSPESGNLLVVYGNPGSGVRAFSPNGTALGILGETGTAVDEPVDIDFVGDDNDLLIADFEGSVIRCDSDGTDCGNFSNALNDLLAPGSPSAIAVNPSAEFTTADVLIADPVGQRVIACNSNGNNCGVFGETDDGDVDSDYSDVFFAPSLMPTTTSTTTTTTLGN